MWKVQISKFVGSICKYLQFANCTWRHYFCQVKSTFFSLFSLYITKILLRFYIFLKDILASYWSVRIHYVSHQTKKTLPCFSEQCCPLFFAWSPMAKIRVTTLPSSGCSRDSGKGKQRLRQKTENARLFVFYFNIQCFINHYLKTQVVKMKSRTNKLHRSKKLLRFRSIFFPR